MKFPSPHGDELVPVIDDILDGFYKFPSPRGDELVPKLRYALLIM